MPRIKPPKITKRSNRLTLVTFRRREWDFEVLSDLEYPLIARHVTKNKNTYYIIAREHFPYGLWIGRLNKERTEIKATNGRHRRDNFKSIYFPSGDKYHFANENRRIEYYDYYKVQRV